jgi:Xaa-Pro dipeptidase
LAQAIEHSGMKRPRPAQPRSVASADARRTWPVVDARLARGAVEWALTRTRTALRHHDIAAALLVDPINIRYATGTSVMPVWTLHSIDRYLLVPAEGEPVLWEFASSPAELTSPSGPLETRTAISWAVFGSGEHSADRAARFAADVAGVLRERGIHDGRIGVDRLDAYGFLALQEAGLHLVPAQLAIEQARAVKGPEEIELIRLLAARVRRRGDPPVRGPTSRYDRERGLGPIRRHRFGEFVECRLMSSGPRTNPWFRETSARPIERGDIVSFDTDLIGPAGYLADLSRAYLVGSTKP